MRIARPLFVVLLMVLLAVALWPAVAQEQSPPTNPVQRVLQGVEEATSGEAGEETATAAEADAEQDGEDGAAAGEDETQTPPIDASQVAEAVGNAIENPGQTWTDFWEGLKDKILGWLPSLLTALLVLAIFFFLNRLAQRILERVMERTRADPGARVIASRLLGYFVLGVGLVMAAGQLGIHVTSLIAGLGIVGLAIGLAAQDSLGNLIAGLTILWDRPFRIGDNVTVAGTFGEVKEIGLRSTRIRTVEQIDAILPNQEIINQKILNHTLNPLFRLGIPLGIAYKEDTREARRVLLEAVRGQEHILDTPEPKVVVTALADSSVNLELRVWLRDPHREREALFALVELSKIALDEAGIEIPFPQRTLHLGDEAVRGRLLGSARLPDDSPPSPADEDSETDP